MVTATPVRDSRSPPFVSHPTVVRVPYSEKLSHCELLAVDEAAAIPLPLVKKLLGPYLVFLSSTVNGYEGTGRALSLKLIDQLRKQQGEGGWFVPRPEGSLTGPG